MGADKREKRINVFYIYHFAINYLRNFWSLSA